jgi:uncharacterized protein (DUF1684 family)
VAAWRNWRGTRDALFRDHAQSPLDPVARHAFDGLPVFPYAPTLRLRVDLAPSRDEAERAVPAGSDGEVVMRPAARTLGLAERLGGELTLYWLGGYGGGLFLPFRDATSGRQTYGGGRYLLDGVKGADLGTEEGRLVLDFNFAYHPSCYSPAWICPLAPAENRLPVAVQAGERLTAEPRTAGRP